MTANSRFDVKKRGILAQLGVPEDEYHDLSPKGSVDEPIRSLIGDINRLDGLVTTSSCSGRVSVFLEGRKKYIDASGLDQEGAASRAGPGGKGGGTWLYISHAPVEISLEEPNTKCMSLFGLQSVKGGDSTVSFVKRSHIHLKFEPMILHVLAASLEDSQRVLTAALAAGFRESGAVSLGVSKSGEVNPLVAVRSAGYSFDAIIGYQNGEGQNITMVDEAYLRTLVGIANERFQVNSERISRFRVSLLSQYNQRSSVDGLEGSLASKSNNPEWEDSEARKRRKRKEGLARQKQLQTRSPTATSAYVSEAEEGNDQLGAAFDLITIPDITS